MLNLNTYETEQLYDDETIKSEYTVAEIREIKEEFLDQLFEMKVSLYANKQLSQWVNTELVCTNKKFHNWLMHLHSRKYRSIPREEFIAEVAAIMTDAVYGYNGNNEEGFNWNGLLTGDESSLSQLFAYCKLPVESGMLVFRNYWNHTIKKEKTLKVDGDKEKVNIWQRANFNSLDQTVEFEDSTSDTVLNLLGAESSLYFYDEGNYQANHFLQWFRENYQALREEIEAKREKEAAMRLEGIEPKSKRLKNPFLTEIQYDYLEARMKYPEFHSEDYHYNLEENKMESFEELTGISSQDASLYKKNIINRIRKQFEKDNPLGKKTNLQLRKEKQIEFWSEFINLVYCDEKMIDQQNELLSSFIVNNMDNTFMSDILYDNLEGEDIFNVVAAIDGGTIRGKTLYKIIELVEEKLNFLETFDTSAVEFYRKESENNGWPKERHQAWTKAEKLRNAEASRVKVLKWSDELNDYIEVSSFEVAETSDETEIKKKRHLRENLMTTGATYKVDKEEDLMK